MSTPAPLDHPETGETEAATKAAVFNAAERLFALHGFQNVSVRDITAEAGVNLASVNYHFGSKDALLFEIFKRRTGELNRERAKLLHEANARNGGVPAVRDVLEAITGEFDGGQPEDAWAVQREDGSWLIDGLIPVPELKDRLDIKELPDEDRGRYNTLAGLVMLLLGRLPRTADVVEWAGWRFEVVDLDGKRVDKVLVARIPAGEAQ